MTIDPMPECDPHERNQAVEALYAQASAEGVPCGRCGAPLRLADIAAVSYMTPIGTQVWRAEAYCPSCVPDGDLDV